MKIVFIIVLTVFNSLAYSQSKNTLLNSEIKSITDDWKLLEYQPENSKELWFFRKNLGAKTLVGHRSLNTLVYFTLKYVPKDQSGLPAKEDSGVLYVFEENIIPLIEEATVSVMVASVLKAGVKDHLFYVSNPDLFIKVIGEYKPALSNFIIEVEKSDDPKWQAYADFPDGT